MMKKALLPASMLALAAGGAGAQDLILLDEITVTAEAEPVETARTGATVTVVTEEELRATAETRVIDYIAALPGVDILTRGGLGTQTSFTLRGISQNYVRVLVDGIDVTDPSAPQTSFDFGLLTTADVRRIEILRGSQSALYGSDAIGGVISIQTAGAAEEGLSQQAAVEAGSYGTFRGSYALGYRDGGNEAALTLSRVVTDGFSAAEEDAGNAEPDGYAATRLSFRLARELGEGVVLGLNGFVEDSTGAFDEQFPVGDGNPALDETSETESRGLRAFAGFDLGPVRNEVALSRYDVSRRVYGSSDFLGVTYPDDNTYAGERSVLSWTGVAELSPDSALRFGAEYTTEDFSRRGSFGDLAGESTAAGAFAEWSLSPAEGVDVTATLRHDDHSTFGGFTTGRLAAAWALSETVTLRGQVATGFRAPSLYELTLPYPGQTLDPETSRSADLGVDVALAGGGLLRATLFRTEVEDLIDYRYDDMTNNGYLQIAGTAVRQGIELEADLPVTERLRLAAGYTYTDSENPPALNAFGGSSWLGLYGRHDLSAALTAEVTDRLSAVVQVRHVADRPTLPDYTLANATLTYGISDSTEAYLRVENLFDEEYQLRQGYGTSDRAVYLGLRTRF